MQAVAKEYDSTCFHIFLDGCLIESKVRSQKAIALSSGEVEFTAIVGGCSEALFVKNVVELMTQMTAKVKARSDSSAARSMTARQGVGRVRHLDSGMMWAQKKVMNGVLGVTAIPTLLDPADIGVKGLSQFRLKALSHMLSIVDDYDVEIGEDELKETELKSKMQKKVNRVMSRSRDDMKLALVMLIGLISGADVASTEGDSSWLDYAMLSVFTLNVSGALSVAAGMWAIGRWLTRDHVSATVRSEGREVQTEESDDPNIVYQLHQRIDRLHEQNDSIQRRLDAEQELSVAREND